MKAMVKQYSYGAIVWRQTISALYRRQLPPRGKTGVGGGEGGEGDWDPLRSHRSRSIINRRDIYIYITINYRTMDFTQINVLQSLISLQWTTKTNTTQAHIKRTRCIKTSSKQGRKENCAQEENAKTIHPLEAVSELVSSTKGHREC